MFRRTWAVALGALLLTFGTTVSAVAAPGGTGRPFRAAASGQVAYDFSNPRHCPLGFTEEIWATGQATHLGSFTVSATHCELFTGPASGISYDGEMTLTAANGDQVFGTYQTTWAFADGKATVSGGLQVNGGTGRFLHASGMLTQNDVISIISPMPPWPVDMAFRGTLSY